MKRVPLELEPIVLAIAAALPFYFNAALSIVPVALYHLALGVIFVWRARHPEASMSRGLLRFFGTAYLVFYVVDGIVVSQSLIRATGHLLFFIAIYQSVDRESERNHPQRLLVIFLIAIASIATSTHITIVFFVTGFTFLLLRQMVTLSHEESARLVGATETGSPANRSVAAYLTVLIVAATAFFPLLPRVRNPFVRGAGFSSQGASTGFSDAIDFSTSRASTSDPRVVARITVPAVAGDHLVPIRLRGGHFDRYFSGRWTSRPVRMNQRISSDAEGYVIARPLAASSTIEIRQTRTVAQNQRLFIPSGTWQVRGPSGLLEGPNQGTWLIPGPGDALIDFSVDVSRDIEPLNQPRRLPSYEVLPAVQTLADSIATNAATPADNAARIGAYLSSQFTYLPSAETLGEAVSVEQFLLTERRGHCEHFAAGMVLLLAARGVPARVAGGYYGGEYNPLGGYWVIRQRDAHAWVEVWEGTHWTTWDPTPASLRPGSDAPNFVVAYLSAVSESINFFWDRYVLTFGLSDQVNLVLSSFYAARNSIMRLRSALGALPALRSVTLLAVAGIAGLIVALVLLILRLRRRASLFELLAVRLTKLGYNIDPSMTGADVLSLVQASRPTVAPLVERVVTLYERDRFSSQPISRAERMEVRMALRNLRS